jgi:hypothetical protein
MSFMARAPKDLRQNLQYRAKLLELGRTSKLARDEMWATASRDPIWFIDSFLWTFNPKDFPLNPRRPFVTWDFQERTVHKIIASIGQNDLIFPKSRAMGATYIILATLFWQWCFRPMQSFLLASAKEDRVDRRDDPSCLFWKLDDFLKCVPAWMRPAFDRTELKLAQLENGSVFNGESTNKNVDRGGRRTAILADEAAAMTDAEKIAASITHVTNTCLWLSTPQGAFGAFYKLHQQMQRESPENVIRLHWTQHPLYSQGLYYDSSNKPRSPWYDKQCLRAPGPKWIAQELDIGFNESGGQYFEQPLIDRLMRTTVRKPDRVGELDFDNEELEPTWRGVKEGRLLYWGLMMPDGTPPPGEYLVGCDIASGKGGEMSSQSAVTVVKAKTGEKVAEWKYNRITPTNFARFCVALCKWFHGAKLIWGSQGPGGDFGKTVADCNYGRIYDDEKGRAGQRTRKPGYAETSPEKRLILLGAYRDALNEGKYINRSEAAVQECRQFIFANGSVEHSSAMQSDEPENKGKLHGDVVIADALTNWLLQDIPPVPKPSEFEPPIGSMMWRHLEMERADSALSGSYWTR